MSVTLDRVYQTAQVMLQVGQHSAEIRAAVCEEPG